MAVSKNNAIFWGIIILIFGLLKFLITLVYSVINFKLKFNVCVF